jgi:hypothetical protein
MEIALFRDTRLLALVRKFAVVITVIDCLVPTIIKIYIL